MNELVRNETQGISAVGADRRLSELNSLTQALIVSGVNENTLRSYRFWPREIEAWLNGHSLNDGLLAAYITGLHAQGKSPATIGQAVAAVRWQAKNTPPQSPPQAGGRVSRGLMSSGSVFMLRWIRA